MRAAGLATMAYYYFDFRDVKKQDIVEYIDSIVRSDWNMWRWNEEDKQLVVDTLSSKADGM